MTASCTAGETRRPRIDRIDPVLSWAFGVVLLVSSIPHWANPYYFLGAVYAYDLVGPGVGQIIAMVLPALQFIVAVCLISRTWLDAAHLIALVMFGCFLTVQSLAHFRDLEISCGCFGPCHETPIGVDSLLTVGGFFLMSLVRNGLRWRSLGSA